MPSIVTKAEEILVSKLGKKFKLDYGIYLEMVSKTSEGNLKDNGRDVSNPRRCARKPIIRLIMIVSRSRSGYFKDKSHRVCTIRKLSECCGYSFPMSRISRIEFAR